MDKIDFEKILIKFLNSPFNKQFDEKLKSALKEQGLEYKDGEIIKTQRRVAAEAKEAIFDDEDELIRKRIYNYINVTLDDNESAEKEKWLTWIEKQGDKDKLIKELVEYKDKYTLEVLEKHINSVNNKDDEVVRKEIIDYCHERLNTTYGALPNIETIKRWLTWLEKQGEQRSKEAIFDDERIRKMLIEFVKGYSAFINGQWRLEDFTTNELIAWLEKQSNEPKWCHHKVDLSDCTEEYCKAYYDGWNNCNMQHSQCKSELDDVAKCLINGMKFYYEDNEEATWGTDKWHMPVKHIIEVLEKQCEQKSFDVNDVYEKGYTEGMRIERKHWLEKQGEFDENIITREDEILQALSIGLSDVTEKLGWKDFGGLPIEEIHTWLERQGESNLIEEMKRRKELYSREKEKAVLYAEKLSLGGRIAVLEELLAFTKEKQSEKNFNNIEPKFKVGDWITDGDRNLFQIVKIDDEWYYADDGDRVCFDVAHDYYHLWTIQDAKNGDVLVYENKIFIAKHFSNLSLAYYYYYGGKFFITDSFYTLTIDDLKDIKPATKDQRDLLFKKMKEAGYEWDAYNKELKKIEQKPTDMVEPKFKVGDFILNGDVTDNGRKEIFKIRNVCSDWYDVENIYDGRIAIITFKQEWSCRLWNITDAKDGDILTEDSCIFILERMKPNETAIVHCCLFDDGDFDSGSTLDFDIDSTHPATKEQRDLLFNEIIKRGYVWDAHYKELKK